MTLIETIYDTYKNNYKLTTDSRAVKPGMVYIALKGERFDGNQFAAQALKSGAAMAVIDNEKYLIDGDDRIVLVQSGLKTLQELAKHHRKNLNIPVIALTGSNGKTTTKELISVALTTRYSLHVTVGNYNNHIGVPLTILGATPDHELMILEMGANHQGEIRDLCHIGLPDVGLITNIGKAHLEGFGGVEGVIKGKSEMYTYLKETGGTIVYNSDDPLLTKLVDGYIPNQSYSPSSTYTLKSSHPKLRYTYQNKEYTTGLVGGYNMANVATAVAVGELMKCDIEDMLIAISNYAPTNNRSQLLKRKGIDFVLDAYNANPSSMKLAVDAFAKSAYESKTLIIGDMLELGDQCKAEHKQILELINSNEWKEVYLVGSHFSFFESEYSKFHFFDSVDELKKKVLTLDKGSTVLIKGSRAIQLEKVIDFLD